MIRLSLPFNSAPEDVREKSTALVYGSVGAGKTALVTQWLYAPTVRSTEHCTATYRAAPSGTLLVSFRTNENLYKAYVAYHLNNGCRALATNAQMVLHNSYRWFAPGHITSGQMLDSIWNYIRQSRRDGVPIERITFDEVEAVGHSFPRICEDDLFWPTLVEMMTTEPVSTLFSLRMDSTGIDDRSHPLVPLVDYLFAASRTDDSGDKFRIECLRRPPSGARNGQHLS